MNAKEIRVSAKVLISPFELAKMSHATRAFHINRLAEYVLQHVKEDDDEPITCEFCESLFGKSMSPVQHAQSWIPDGNLIRVTIYTCDGGYEKQAYIHLYKSGQKVKIVTTRGQLRNLLTALGVNQ